MGDIDFDYELWSNISREAKHFVANLLVYKQVICPPGNSDFGPMTRNPIFRRRG